MLKKRLSGKEAAEKRAKDREIAGRSRRLLARLSVRPKERQSLVEIVELTYAQENYIECIKHIKRVINLDNERNGAPATSYVSLRYEPTHDSSIFATWVPNTNYETVLSLHLPRFGSQKHHFGPGKRPKRWTT